MALRALLRHALAGAALGAIVFGLLLWADLSLALRLTSAAAIGGLLGWLLDRQIHEPLRRLAERVMREDAGTEPLSGSKQVERVAAAMSRSTSRLRSRIERSEAELRGLQEILESMSDGVLVADGRHRVVLHNQAFGDLFAANDARSGQTVLAISRSPALVRFLDRLAAGETALTQRIESEAGRTLELRGRMITGERKVIVARDLTEQLRLDESRRDLVANVSHELRTPLTAIRGYAENLSDGAIVEPATAARFLERILAQCGRLEALLEDLLALSRLERDRPVALEPGLNLAALTARSVETVRGLAEERQVELRFEPSPVPPIAGNEESLARLLLNLLENAIKYNREGGNVTVGLAAEGTDLVLSVADTGIGVPRRDLSRIFERFYRVDAGRSREEGGTGLGLAIVKHAAQLHGGRVEVSSDLGQGSVFRVFLPIDRR